MCFYKPIPKSMVMYGKIVNIKRRKKKKKRERQPYIKEYLYCFLIIKIFKKNMKGPLAHYQKSTQFFFLYINKLTLK